MVLFGANATHEEKLLTVGKALKSRCFRNARMPNGLIYRTSNVAWMTATLFEEYVPTINNKMTKENRNVNKAMAK
ncbi:hypothetical protein HPB50_022027 [Hyalomma asiaticum]|uniref:Uncharacterized protein n=1 Tax=Hyalomma asiaticum TaxID=266040 RepID=A0ACB7SYX7_HYAAI|nr:hypothetical protein HPB50_022027 [Hyalomma asiaticum]